MRDSTHEELDEKIATLSEHATEWARLPLKEKIALGERLLEGNYRVAERQVEAAIVAKRIPKDSPLVGEEWLGGPLITLRTLRSTLKSLEHLQQGRSPQLKPGSVRTRPNGQVAVEVFPAEKWDSLLFKDFKAEIWMEPEVTASGLADTMGVFYQQEQPEGKVALVLGAGNIASIGPLDVIYKLFAEGQVCLLKMNPVNDYLGEFIEEAFSEFIQRGFLKLAYGGAEVGAYLCQHEGIDEIHITGSDATHDAIVYGVGEEGEARKARDEPQTDKRITSELGNVSPIIVVPGTWSKSDLDFHAENIATQLASNGAFNCNAGRVVITHASWPQRDAFLDALRQAYRRIPQRYPYYPGARERHAKWVEANSDQAELFGKSDADHLPWALISGLDPKQRDNICFSQESFCGVQAETPIEADGVEEFLERAVAFANDTLWGTLNACIIVHPETESRHRAAVERAIEDLHYGSVVLNHWPALAYGFGVTTWGAYPGHTNQDIQSGVGVVHNAYLFDRPQKSVIRGPFKVFPKPAWFVTNARMHAIGPKLVDFEMNPSPLSLPAILWHAARG